MTAVVLVDVGNSRIKWCFDDPDAALPSGPGDAIPLADVESLAVRWAAAGPRSVEAAYVSSVASPLLDGTIERTLTSAWPSIRITRVAAQDAGFGIVNGYDAPSTLGVDRWLAMVGAHALLPSQPLLVCTFGTATTLDLLIADEDGSARFVGGLILPGVDAMKAALVGGTARLFDRPGSLVDFATDTADAIASGIATAQIGAVARTLGRSRDRAGARVTVVVSGGAAAVLGPWLDTLEAPWHAVARLVLVGLAVVVRADYDGATANGARNVARRD